MGDAHDLGSESTCERRLEQLGSSVFLSRVPREKLDAILWQCHVDWIRYSFLVHGFRLDRHFADTDLVNELITKKGA